MLNCIDGVFGTRTRGSMMECAEESTEVVSLNPGWRTIIFHANLL